MSIYQKHKRRWEKCCKCKLCDYRKNVVLCRGTLPCNILFIGEAPGLSEDVLGKPFVGPAGKLLDRIVNLAFNNLEASYSCAFTNLVACVPKEQGQHKLEPPPYWAIEKCSPRLQEIINITDPSMIIAVGQLAAEYVEVDATITHPSFILSKLGPSQQPLAMQRAVHTIEDTAKLIPPF